MLDNLAKKVTVAEKTDQVVRTATEGQSGVDSAGALVGKADDKIFLLNKQNNIFQNATNKGLSISAKASAHVSVPTPAMGHSPGFSSLAAGRVDVLLVDNPAAIDLEPEPIPRDWILSGAPVASSKMLTRSRDWLSSIVVWDCTPGCFRWHYNKEEILFVVFGQATVTNEKGQKLDFGAGDVVLFPAGVSCIWDIKDRIRKVAFLRETLWPPLGMCQKGWAKILRMAGLGGKSPL